MIDCGQFWYVACPSEWLTANRSVSVTLLDQWIVCFRDSAGRPAALPDRCLHRCGRLSRGTVHRGLLRCPYHGWKYDESGRVVEIPSAGESHIALHSKLSTPRYDTREQDGYVYVRLTQPLAPIEPFPMPHYRESGWQNIRLVHDFASTITHCVENFIDIPHTAYVHHGIFRKESRQMLEAEIRRSNGEVHVSYKNESRNIGSFGWLLNPRGGPVQHTDSFFMPNITHVAYRIGSRVEYLITSQSVPITGESTRVFTDITFRFGIWSRIARPFARRQARRVIRQDIDELNAQMEVIRKHPAPFVDTPADFIHKMISQIREAIARGDDPRLLPEITRTVTFWV
ncbi:MAG TPA: Rieske 2Fe-2S domain-containing protein [Verrucomicrobiales bacterium]|nr:Rieske 2Fe-2S domain-containing protein [Verrucomicrobiales bacterium]